MITSVKNVGQVVAALLDQTVAVHSDVLQDTLIITRNCMFCRHNKPLFADNICPYLLSFISFEASAKTKILAVHTLWSYVYNSSKAKKLLKNNKVIQMLSDLRSSCNNALDHGLKEALKFTYDSDEDLKQISTLLETLIGILTC